MARKAKRVWRPETDELGPDDWVRVLALPWTQKEGDVFNHLRAKSNQPIMFCPYEEYYSIGAKFRYYGMPYRLRIITNRYQKRLPLWQKGINLWKVRLAPK